METVLLTFKQAFKYVAKISIFVINRYLQAYIFKNQQKNKRFFRTFTVQKKTIYAVFLNDKEQCNPCFTSLEQAKKPFFQPRLISVPVLDSNNLWFTIQIETDNPEPHQKSKTKP